MACPRARPPNRSGSSTPADPRSTGERTVHPSVGSLIADRRQIKPAGTQGTGGEARPEAGAECDREHPSTTAPGTERGLADAGRLGVPGEPDPQIRAADPFREQWSDFETVDRVELVQPADQCPSAGHVEGPGEGEGDTGHRGRGLLDSAIDRGSELPEHDVGTLGGARRDRRPEDHGVGSARFVIGVDDTGLDRRAAHIERRDHPHRPQARWTLPVVAGLVPVIPSSLPWRDD